MRRGSIARLMTAIGLSALALVLLREWLGPANRFGFLGLLALMILVDLVGWLMAGGIIRRFFAGCGAAGLVLLVAVLISPVEILDFCRDRLVLPAHRRLHPTPAWPPTPLENEAFRSRIETDINFRFNGVPGWWGRRAALYGGLRELQALILIPMAVLSATGGLIAAGCHWRWSRTPSPADIP